MIFSCFTIDKINKLCYYILYNQTCSFHFNKKGVLYVTPCQGCISRCFLRNPLSCSDLRNLRSILGRQNNHDNHSSSHRRELFLFSLFLSLRAPREAISPLAIEISLRSRGAGLLRRSEAELLAMTKNIRNTKYQIPNTKY